MRIEQAEGRMRVKEDTINTRVEIGARLVVFQEVHVPMCDKLIVLRSECQGLQYRQSPGRISCTSQMPFTSLGITNIEGKKY